MRRCGSSLMAKNPSRSALIGNTNQETRTRTLPDDGQRRPHMEQFFIDVFGIQNHLSTGQEAARAVLIFAYGLALLRLSGPRMFGHWSALDIVISIMVGSALARAMAGSAPLIGTMVAAAVMAFLHVLLAHWVAH